MNIAGFVVKWARATPQRPAVAVGARVLYDYATLAQRVAALAGGLYSLGSRPGDRVGLLMPNRPQYFECLLACWHAGLAAVPINARLHPREFNFMLEHSGASLCLAAGPLADGVSAPGVRVIDIAGAHYRALLGTDPLPLQESAPDSLAWLFYTSGTTGRPKGAMISQRNLLTMCHCYVCDIDDRPPWRSILHPAPLTHGSGLYALAHLMKGSCQVLPESGGFEPAEIFDLIAAWPDSVFFAAPTMIRRLTGFGESRDSANLKAIIFGGAPMYLPDIEAFLERFGPRLAQLYGQGESPMTITGMSTAVFAERDHPRWQARIGSAGLPQSAVEVRTLDARGNPLGVGEAGEIVVRGDSVMLGYWDDEHASAHTLRDGWLWTGDIGSFDADGFLTLKDRSKDVIISGGSNVYPREVEEVLLQHANVAEACVIGRPEPEWGEVVVAYIVPEAGAVPDESELDALCLQQIARFKRPKAYRFIEELPKNNYGKVLKTRLRELDN